MPFRATDAEIAEHRKALASGKLVTKEVKGLMTHDGGYIASVDQRAISLSTKEVPCREELIAEINRNLIKSKADWLESSL